MNLKEWYGRSVKLPDKFDRYASVFAASSIHIIRSAMGAKERKYSIRFHDGADFYVDHNNQSIFLSSRILSARPKLRPNPKASVTDAISALLGICVHEGLHVQLSLRDNMDIFKASELPESLFSQALTNFFNLMEDYYVDEYGCRNYPWSKWMFQAGFDYFFEESTLYEIQEPTIYKGKLRTAFDVMLFLQIGIVSKNPLLFPLIESTHPSVYPILVKARKIIDIHDPLARARFSGLIYREIVELDEVEQEKLDGNKNFGEIYAIFSDLDAIAAKMVSRSNNGEETILMNELVRESKYSKIETVDFTDHVIYHIVPDENHNLISVSDVFLRLESLSRALSSAPKNKGVRNNKGYRVSDPSRIVTDGRIFRDPTEKLSMLPFEVIILVDCSGSMEHRERIRRAFEAACGGAFGLEAGRHKVTILGHTGDIGVGLATTGNREFAETKNTVIYVVKRHYESVRIAQARSEQIVKSYSKCQNRDGEAILAASKYFCLPKHNRAMIVISDGEPCADDYFGPEAIEHTKQCVAKVRASDVTVLSISIDKSAVDSNNEIYGEASNTFSGDPAVIERILSMLLRNGD